MEERGVTVLWVQLKIIMGRLRRGGGWPDTVVTNVPELPT